jgi:DNA sulfur modification protein DndD
MIEKILVESFGLFEKRDFALSDSTVFYGPNEAGKTTLFDALFTRLCKIPKRGDYVRDIYQRHGDRMNAEILPKEHEESFEVDEFKNLYSIRSGDLLTLA